MKKICTRCKLEKSINEFYKRKDSKNKIRSQCKDCFKFYLEINKEQIKNQHHKYYLKHEIEIKNRVNKYYIKNKKMLINSRINNICSRLH